MLDSPGQSTVGGQLPGERQRKLRYLAQDREIEVFIALCPAGLDITSEREFAVVRENKTLRF